MPTTHHFLPTLQNASIKAPARRGLWEPDSAAVLTGIAEGIDVSNSARTRGVSSIPDVWARAVLFQNALHDPAHPLHKTTVKEWKGLLSLLALRRAYGYPVEVTPVLVEEASPEGQVFVDALRRLRPAPVELESGVPYDWMDTLLIRYEGKPVGAFAPGSLVYTAAGYRERLAGSGLDLCEGDGSLRPPTDPHTSHYVAEWLDWLVEELSGALREAGAAQNTAGLLRAWRDELADAHGRNNRGRVDAANVKLAAAPADVTPQSWPPLQNYEVYARLLTPLEEDTQSGTLRDRSSLFLQVGREREASGDPDQPDRLVPRIHLTHEDQPVEGVVVIHEQTLTQDAQIWGLRRLRSLGESVSDVLKRHFTDKNGDPRPAGDAIAGKELWRERAIWIRPEAYFLTDTLVAPRRGEGSHVLAQGEFRANAGGEYLLPFRKTVLGFFSPEEIERELRPRFDTSDDGRLVTFTFELPIGPLPEAEVEGKQGPAGIGDVARTRDDHVQRITIQRTYTQKEPGDPDDGTGTIRRESLPVVDLFPNYLGPAWRRYYLFQGAADAYTATPYAWGAGLESRTRTDENFGPRHTARITEIYGDRNVFPEGVEIRAADNDEALGLILVQRPQWTAGLQDTWTVGVDFGTSNTNVWQQKGESEAQSWLVDFPSHLRSLTVSTSGPAGAPSEEAEKSAREQARNELLQRFFVPNRQVAFPIATFLDIHKPKHERDQGRARLLLDYFVHFPPGYAWPDTVRFNIKWADVRDRVTKEFLESLAFLILLKAVKARVHTIDLRCSHPKAFSDDEESQLKGEWRQVHDLVVHNAETTNSTDFLVTVNGDRPVEATAVERPHFETEGTAAGYFFSDGRTFRNADGATQGKSVIVDVGGGTTDIAFWYDGRIVTDDSVRLAGGVISRYIQARPRLMEMLFTPAAVRSLSEVGSDVEWFGAVLNLVLRSEDERIRRKLVDNANQPEIQRLRQLIALEFGAIAFHVGTLLAAAEKWGAAPGLTGQINASGVGLYWGGNASKLITWIDLGDYSPAGLAADFLNGLLITALKDAEMNPPIHHMLQMQSTSHKSEAAGGLTVLPDDVIHRAREGQGRVTSSRLTQAMTSVEEGGSRVPPKAVIAGERVALAHRETPVEPTDYITTNDLFEGDRHQISEVTAERLGRFVGEFNRLGQEFGFLNADTVVPNDPATRTKVAEKAKDLYVKLQRKDEGSRYVEPVFITEVRELLDIVIGTRG